MWIVQVALRRPYTFIVLALLLPLIGGLAIMGTPLSPGMPTDIFPDIKIPVIAVTFQYAGMPPDEMAGRITAQIERYATTIVNDIEHVESQSYPGMTVIKIFFQPGVDINLAMAQVTAFGQTSLRFMPAGVQPPLILKYNAATVPILQLAMSSNTLTESQLFDTGNQVVRTQIGTVYGAAIPYPYGGAARQVQIDLKPDALRAQGLTASDVNNAITNQNLIVPAGTQKIGDTEYNVKLNASPFNLDEINDLPIRGQAGGNVTYIRDVAFVHDGHPPQTNIVRVDGRRAVLMTIQKTGAASTLNIVNEIRSRLPRVRELLPAGASIDATGDQSVFVRDAVKGVVVEAVLAACLTALMVLLFLGSWRSTLIIAISIPLSIIVSIIILDALGETINLMTLGGLALAVGILVDDATVTIENINRHLESGQEVEPAILKGSFEITIPALVSTLAICIVFVPMFLLSGVARYLFVPLAEAVVFAMLTSYILSRTLVPTLAKYWLRTAAEEHAGANPHFLRRFQRGFEARFEKARDRYQSFLTTVLEHRTAFVTVFLGAAVASMLIYPFLGRNFFPDVDAGQIKLHIRGQTGLRVEDTAALVDHIEAAMREVIPPNEIDSMVDNVGLPVSSINMTYANSGTFGSSDADILVALKPNHASTAAYLRQLRVRLPQEFPGTVFGFLPADIVSQILNFGVPAPIDIQISGPSPQNREIANALVASLRRVPGLVDLRLGEVFNQPELRVATDRSRAQQLGISQSDIANDLLLTLSGSVQIAPTFWLNPNTGLQYPLVAQAPQYRMTSLQDLQNLPVATGSQQQILGALATITRGFGSGVVVHRDAQPIIDIYGAAQDRDLGAIEKDINAAIAKWDGKLPKGTHIAVRGQVQTMTASYTGLAIGLIGAIVLVYLLIVINFQSWTDAFIIITALPAAVAGIAWMLLITGTTLSVPALTGAIMCMGVATANSILVVSFARDRLNQGATPLQAAHDAGLTRFRPVLMTALAMIIGMLPMSLGMGDGGEQNAPLGRAVIGGLIFATVATLVFVPTVFAALHGRRHSWTN
jgi:multidrug efflux pump subunit AcrB